VDITYEWLKAHGFKELPREERQPTPHVRRAVAGGRAGGRYPFESPDDLCLELAEWPGGGHWSCWLVQVEPRRHIYLRHLRARGELTALYEALTGRLWEGAPA
jgi:hypothetical protein